MRSKWSKKLLYEFALSLFILVLPYLLFTHLWFSFDGSAPYFDFFGYRYFHGFDKNSTFIWFLLIKAIPIVLLAIWYINCPYKWRHSILIPLAPFAATIIDVLISNGADFPHFVLSFFCVMTIILYLDWRLNGNGNHRTGFTFSAIDLFRRHPKSIYTAIRNKFESHRYQRGYKFIKNLMSTKESLEEKTFIYGSSEDRDSQTRAKDNAIIFILILTAVVYFLHDFIPRSTQTLDFYFLSIESNGFNDVQSFVWYISIKLCIILPLSIWFITSPNWWRYAILSPIILFTFQLWEGVRPETVKLDEYEYIAALPFMTLLLTFLLLLARIVNYRSKILDLYDSISGEIETKLDTLTFSDSKIGNIKNEFELLRKRNRTEKEAQENLEALVKFRSMLQNKLK